MILINLLFVLMGQPPSPQAPLLSHPSHLSWDLEKQELKWEIRVRKDLDPSLGTHKMTCSLSFLTSSMRCKGGHPLKFSPLEEESMSPLLDVINHYLMKSTIWYLSPEARKRYWDKLGEQGAPQQNPPQKRPLDKTRDIVDTRDGED